MTLAINDIVARLKTTGADELGRWTYQTFGGRGDRALTIITVYQVCKKSTTKGKSTAADQQYSIHRQQNEKNADPRFQFRLALTKFIKACRTRQETLLVVGDFNEVIGKNKRGLSKICFDCGISDVMAHFHDLPQFATYARGSSRIDHALASDDLLDFIIACGYEPFEF